MVIRNDDDVKNAVHNALLGSAPERKAELDKLWNMLEPRFELTDDTHEGERFVMEAGMYRYVRFNHRVVRAFWIAAFAAWEAYRAVAEAADLDAVNLSCLQELIKAFDLVLSSPVPELEPLPAGLPEPGHFDQEPTLRAPGEIAVIAIAFPLLHEVRHLQHQQEGDAADLCEQDRTRRHEEELSCDAFATQFLLERLEDYARGENVSATSVRRKRELGIYFAFFAMTLTAQPNWGASASHPALQTRINAVRTLMGGKRDEVAEAIATMAFAALHTLMVGAPGMVPAPTASGNSDT
jgi:hypothetical protein